MQNFHPYFVHFPIALLAMGVLWDILGVILHKDSLRNAGWWAQLFGVLAILAAVTTGLFAEGTVPHGEASHSIMETHKVLELTAAGIFLVLLIWRFMLRMSLPSRTIPLVLYLGLAGAAVAVMLYGAHLGGRMVYEFGVGGTAVTQPESAGHHHEHGDEEEGHDHDPDEHNDTLAK
jgi:uncharacterized membrane protein